MRTKGNLGPGTRGKAITGATDKIYSLWITYYWTTVDFDIHTVIIYNVNI